MNSELLFWKWKYGRFVHAERKTCNITVYMWEELGHCAVVYEADTKYLVIKLESSKSV